MGELSLRKMGSNKAAKYAYQQQYVTFPGSTDGVLMSIPSDCKDTKNAKAICIHPASTDSVERQFLSFGDTAAWTIGYNTVSITFDSRGICGHTSAGSNSQFLVLIIVYD